MHSCHFRWITYPATDMSVGRTTRDLNEHNVEDLPVPKPQLRGVLSLDDCANVIRSDKTGTLPEPDVRQVPRVGRPGVQCGGLDACHLD